MVKDLSVPASVPASGPAASVATCGAPLSHVVQGDIQVFGPSWSPGSIAETRRVRFTRLRVMDVLANAITGGQVSE
jgi:hypothetical protein